jgi:hypothetical protein
VEPGRHPPRINIHTFPHNDSEQKSIASAQGANLTGHEARRGCTLTRDDRGCYQRPLSPAGVWCSSQLAVRGSDSAGSGTSLRQPVTRQPGVAFARRFLLLLLKNSLLR